MVAGSASALSENGRLRVMLIDVAARSDLYMVILPSLPKVSGNFLLSFPSRGDLDRTVH